MIEFFDALGKLPPSAQHGTLFILGLAVVASLVAVLIMAITWYECTNAYLKHGRAKIANQQQHEQEMAKIDAEYNDPVKERERYMALLEGEKLPPKGYQSEADFWEEAERQGHK